MKLRDLYKVLGGMKELKGFIGIVGRPQLVCGSVIVNVRDAKNPNFI